MKVLVFRFIGGMRNGEEVRSDAPGENQEEADMLWKQTWNGTVGRRFDVPIPAAGVFQRYQIKSKHDAEGEIHITCQHVS